MKQDTREKCHVQLKSLEYHAYVVELPSRNDLEVPASILLRMLPVFVLL